MLHCSLLKVKIRFDFLFHSQIASAKLNNHRARSVSADDGTVAVIFTTTISEPRGDKPPKPEDVQNTINKNINETGCDDCTVTTIGEI